MAVQKVEAQTAPQVQSNINIVHSFVTARRSTAMSSILLYHNFIARKCSCSKTDTSDSRKKYVISYCLRQPDALVRVLCVA